MVKIKLTETRLKKMISEAVKETLAEKNSNVKEREYIMRYADNYIEMYNKIGSVMSMLNEMSNTRLNSHISKLLIQVIEALDKAGEYYQSQRDTMQ